MKDKFCCIKNMIEKLVEMFLIGILKINLNNLND